MKPPYQNDLIVLGLVAVCAFALGSSCFRQSVTVEPAPPAAVSVSPAPLTIRPIVVLVPQNGRKPLLPAVAPLPEAHIESLIAELKKAGLSDADAAVMRRDATSKP